MSARLILVRHGETEGNVGRRLDTRLPGAPLTPAGEQQARDLGVRLARQPPVALVSSEAVRARQTAALIAAATGVPARALPGLHEVQAGDLEDRSDDDAHAAFRDVMRAWFTGDPAVRVPGGESGADVLERFLPVVADLRARYLDPQARDPSAPVGDLVVVSHGTAIRLAANALTSVPGGFVDTHHLRNTDTVELVPDGDGWECVRWGTWDPPFAADDLDRAGAAEPMG